MIRESMCDSCMKPGHCCRSVFLTGGPFGDPMSFEKVEHELMRWKLPFRPLEYREDEHRWRFWCPNLQRDGRCGDYENRPQLCRDYEPGREGLCVHYWAIDDEGALPL